jgi:ribosome-associated protein
LKKAVNDSETLLHTVVDAIQDIKGEDIVHLDLRGLDEAVTDFFVICHGNSTTQVNAIGQNVMKRTKEDLNEKPWQHEGFGNAEWICLDYSNLVVHVFLREKRTFYKLEELWSDAERVEYSENISQA